MSGKVGSQFTNSGVIGSPVLGEPASGILTNLTGTLTSPTFVTPALGTPASGVGTNISGVVTTALTAGSLPTHVTGGAGLQNGITNLQAWRLNATIQTNGEDLITGSLEAVDTDGFGIIGNAMTQSSGIFTFPKTGIWLILVQGYMRASSAAAAYAEMYIDTTLNNSAYSRASVGISSGYETNAYMGLNMSFVFDVTNTTNCKCKFLTGFPVTSQTHGTTAASTTQFTFMRIGDTA